MCPLRDKDNGWIEFSKFILKMYVFISCRNQYLVLPIKFHDLAPLESINTFIFLEILLTRSHLIVMGGRAIAQYVFHLQELVGSVTSNDGEAKALWALFQ